MRGFRPDAEGWSSSLEPWEREYLAGLFKQIADLLGAAGPADVDSESTGTTGGTTARSGESLRDGEVLAALDFDSEAARAAPPSLPVPVALAPLLDVLLPDASEDPDVAVEIAALTRERLRVDKRSRLEDVVYELLEPTGAGGAVLVPVGREDRWLGALNDARLVLAERLQIDSPEAAERVHAVAWDEAPPDEGETARWSRTMALSYDMLSWWQESLVAALLNAEGSA
ncbi:DUF2017 family protein [Actinomyces sp.]|uniref:DUF2017 family protein n=1 Tax=Actinomyces sp. TaxID=29317 RepID=UPI0026DC8ADE|nr:DUF2017 family protein [Actinomyces sp.]MDO4899072.1 DUF2017 family protein [Actinomyces sp.]